MSEPVATLVVNCDPPDWRLGGTINCIVRIDGDPPTVRDPDGCIVDGKMLYRRPLRAGDRVTLAAHMPAPCPDCGGSGGESPYYCHICDGGGVVDAGGPFATATVARVDKCGCRTCQTGATGHRNATVTDVQPI